MTKTKKYYSPQQIADQGLFPWLTHRKTIIAWIVKQIELGNRKKYGLIQKFSIDSADDMGKHGTRYFVTQAGINKIQADFESGRLFKGK